MEQTLLQIFSGSKVVKLIKNNIVNCFWKGATVSLIFTHALYSADMVNLDVITRQAFLVKVPYSVSIDKFSAPNPLKA